MAYDIIRPLYGFTVADDCPIVVERGNFLRERNTNKTFLQLKFVNYGFELIQSVYFHGTVIDENIAPIPNGSFDTAFQNINCAGMVAFGSKQLIPVVAAGQYALIDRIDIEFASGTKQTWQGDMAHCCLPSKEVSVPAQFRGVVGTANKVIIEPTAVNTKMHRCCCGALASNTDPCQNCGRTMNDAMHAITYSGMEEAFNAHSAPTVNTVANPQGSAKSQSPADSLLTSLNNFYSTSNIPKPLAVSGIITAVLALALIIIVGLLGHGKFYVILTFLLIPMPLVAAVGLFMYKQPHAAIGFMVLFFDSFHANSYGINGINERFIDLVVFSFVSFFAMFYYTKRYMVCNKSISNGSTLAPWGTLCGSLIVSHLFMTDYFVHLYYDKYGPSGMVGSFYMPGIISTLLVYAIPVAILFYKKTKHRVPIAIGAAVSGFMIYAIQKSWLDWIIWSLLCWVCYKEVFDEWDSDGVFTKSPHNINRNSDNHVDTATSTTNTEAKPAESHTNPEDILNALKTGGKMGTSGLLIGTGVALVLAFALFGRSLDRFWWSLTGYGTFSRTLGTAGIVLFLIYCIPIAILFIKNATHKWPITAAAAIAFLSTIFIMKSVPFAIIAWLVVCWLCFTERHNYTL